MISFQSVLIVCALVHAGYALQCWNCQFDGDQNNTCLRQPPPSNATDLKTNYVALDGYDIKTCDEGAACNKMTMKMEMFGREIDVVSRQCIPGLGALSGRCIGQEIPGLNGKNIKAEMCICNSDICNSANLPVQASVLAVLFSAMSTLIVKLL